MGIWDEVNETEELTQVYSRIRSLNERCAQAEEVCLRVLAMQHTFKETMENEAVVIYQDQKAFPEIREESSLINFVYLTNIYRRIDYIDNIYELLKDEVEQHIEQAVRKDVINQIHEMIENLKDSYNMCIENLIRLAKKRAAVYLLCDDVPVALLLDEAYLAKYYFELASD